MNAIISENNAAWLINSTASLPRLPKGGLPIVIIGLDRSQKPR